MRTEALANPEALKWARRAAGLKLQDAARKAAVKLERIESWERGERRPTIIQLRKLADIYKRPLAVFYLEQPPADEPPPSDFRRLDPGVEEPLSPELRLAIRTARTRREAALELLEDLGEEPPPFTLRARLSDDAEEVAAHLRSALETQQAPVARDARQVFNVWRAAAESAGILVFQAAGVDVAEMRGFSISEHPLPTVVLNIRDAFAARSFSLLHELTHVLLDQGGLCLLNENPASRSARRVEVFANHVAAAALLPAESLLTEPEAPQRPHLDLTDESIEALARRYGASPEAVVRRLVVLGRLAPEFYERRREEYRARYADLRRRKNGGRPTRARLAVARAGNRFVRLVLEAYDEERITSSDVAELLGERLKHLEEIRRAVESAPAGGEQA